MMRWGLSTVIFIAMVGAVMAAPVVLPHVIPQQQPDKQSDTPPLTGDMAEFTPLVSRVPASQLGFQDDHGQTHHLGDWRGKFLVLNFWATWCGPCVEELPTLDALTRAPVTQNMAVVTISEDQRGAAAVDPFLDSNRLLALPRFVDPDGVAGHALEVEALPTTFLVDRQGRLIGSLEGGADWNGADARALIAWYARRG